MNHWQRENGITEETRETPSGVRMTITHDPRGNGSWVGTPWVRDAPAIYDEVLIKRFISISRPVAA